MAKIPEIKPKQVLVYNDISLVLWPNVYIPKEDSFFFLSKIETRSNDTVCDLGCGCGLFSVEIAKRVKKVYSFDINPYAVKLTKENARLNGVYKKVVSKMSDLFSNARQNSFDLIVSNISQLPTPRFHARNAWISFGDNGGRDGRDLINRILAGAKDYLKPVGRLVLFHYGILDIDKSKKMLSTRGFKTKIIGKRKLNLGRLTFERKDYIESLGYKFLFDKKGEPFQFVYVLEATLIKN